MNVVFTLTVKVIDNPTLAFRLAPIIAILVFHIEAKVQAFSNYATQEFRFLMSRECLCLMCIPHKHTYARNKISHGETSMKSA